MKTAVIASLLLAAACAPEPAPPDPLSQARERVRADEERERVRECANYEPLIRAGESDTECYKNAAISIQALCSMQGQDYDKCSRPFVTQCSDIAMIRMRCGWR